MQTRAIQWRNAPWALLLAAALFVRLLVPQGYMVAQDDRAGIAVAMCNTDGTWVIPFADDTPAHEEADKSGSACQFAGHSAAALGAPDGLSLAVPRADRAIFANALAIRLAPRAPPGLPPATGPPAFS